MREFVMFQSMWAMQDHLGRDPAPLPEQLGKIAAAGFDGVTDHYGTADQVQRLGPVAREYGLQIEGQAFPRNRDDLAIAIDAASRYGCHHLTLQADVRPRTLAAAMQILEQWQRLAEQADFPILLETHRYRITNDLHFTVDLLEQMPDIKLLADLSHYVVAREIPEPAVAEDEALVHKILQHSWGFHGRIASCEHVQVPLSFAQHQIWVDRFLGWWRYGIADWLARPEVPGSLSFTCELGPPPYGITDASGYEITDRWHEALSMKAMVQQVWDSCLVSGVQGG